MDRSYIRTEYLDKPLEINPNQLHKRVAQSIASVEIGDKAGRVVSKVRMVDG